MSSTDNTLFYKMAHERFVGVLVTHIDDVLHTGNVQFEESVKKVFIYVTSKSRDSSKWINQW